MCVCVCVGNGGGGGMLQVRGKTWSLSGRQSQSVVVMQGH